MQMTSNAFTKNIRLFLLVFAATALILGCISYAKGQTPTSTSEKVEEVQQQVQATDQQLDLTTVGVVGGTAASVAAIVKGVMDQKTNTKRDRTTDRDAGKFIALMSKFYQAKYMYPHKTDKEILDMPISNNPMSLMTLGQAITAEADRWNEGNQQYWNLPAIQMSVPTNTTIEAVKNKESYPTIVGVSDTQKQVKPESPATPATSVQASQPPQQKPAATTTTNTTVGK